MFELYSILFSPMQTYNGSSTPSENVYSIMALVVFMVLIAARRIYRGMNGRIYRNSRVFTLPVIYLILTLYSIIPLGFADVNYFYVLILLPLGILLGLRFGGNVTFFKKNNMLFYKRSPFILMFWLASFIVRFSLIFLYPGNTQIFIVVDSVLSLTAGLIIGESIHTLNKRKEFSDASENEFSESALFSR